ncbi:hypothetical protein [Halomarina ordinaria]|uniref:DUF4366 domain-containing protein n=1 Tax=Halomarina ordinaria TaxID=3033939 RepID=A0ABD5U4D4_9EURY|nr:hypothetical protein [Halomarina sp. PSRA2]
MPDITVFEADFKGATFNAPFSKQSTGSEDDEEGGGRGKLFVLVGFLAGLALPVGGFLAFRKFRGGDEEDAEEFDEFESEYEYEEFDPERFESEEDESNRKLAVGAVVGLLFVVALAAVVKLRGGDEEEAEEPEVTVTLDAPASESVREAE